MVPVLVDEALAIAEEKALPLQPVIEILRIGAVALRQPGIVDLYAIPDFDACRVSRFVNAVLATDKDGLAKALRRIGDGGADHRLLLAFGEDDTLGPPLNLLVDAGQHAGDGVPPRRKRPLVLLDILERLAGHAAVHGGPGHGRRDGGHQARIERRGNDIALAELRARPAIGSGHLVRHILACELGDGVGGRDLHLHVDRRRPHIERAPEDEREAKHVIDLVRIIGTPRGDDHILAHRIGVLRRDFGVGVGHGENDRVRRHSLDHRLCQRALGGKAEEDVGVLHRILKAARLGLRGMGGFPLVHALGASLVDHALGVAHQHVFG